MKKNFTLKTLKVESFITNFTPEEAQKNRGGGDSDNSIGFKCTFNCSGNPACY